MKFGDFNLFCRPPRRHDLLKNITKIEKQSTRGISYREKFLSTFLQIRFKLDVRFIRRLKRLQEHIRNKFSTEEITFDNVRIVPDDKTAL